MKITITKKQIKELCEFHANTFKPCKSILKGNEVSISTLKDAEDLLWKTVKINGALMHKFNKIFNLYGIEECNIEEYSFNDNFIFSYVNTGDTYAPTIIYSARYDKYYIMSVGNFMERAECRKLRGELS